LGPDSACCVVGQHRLPLLSHRDDGRKPNGAAIQLLRSTIQRKFWRRQPGCGADFHYRIQIRGAGPVKVQYTVQVGIRTRSAALNSPSANRAACNRVASERQSGVSTGAYAEGLIAALMFGANSADVTRPLDRESSYRFFPILHGAAGRFPTQLFCNHPIVRVSATHAKRPGMCLMASFFPAICMTISARWLNADHLLGADVDGA